MAKILGVIMAILIVGGALPAKARADAPCVPATGDFTVPTASTFVVPAHSLATLRWSDRSAEIFRVPVTVQVTVINGWGSFRGYNPGNCTENQLEQTARDEAWRTGRTVGDIYSMPTRLQVTAVGYYPTPTPYVPIPQPVPSPYPFPIVPQPVAPSFPSFPYPPPVSWMPQPCGPLNYTTVSPDLGRVYGAAVVRVKFRDYALKVVRSITGDQTTFIREAETIEVIEAPGCATNVVGTVASNWIGQGGSISFDNAPAAVQNNFSLVRRP